MSLRMPECKLPSGQPINMVLIGKTGHGKSDTGNTILGGNHFIASDDAVSVTTVNQSKGADVGGRMLNVVDTPGCMDTTKGDDILKEIAAAVTTHPEGYDAFLLVLKYPVRMTDEEIKAIEQMEDMFGKEVYDYAVVIFTHGDSFEAKQKKLLKQGEPAQTFQQYIEKDLKSADEHSLGPLFRKVEERVILFNNMEDDDFKKREMVCDLVRKIDDNHKSQRYNNHIFEKAQQLKQKMSNEPERVEGLFFYMKRKFPGCSIM